jgi:nitric oxide reductase subunit B
MMGVYGMLAVGLALFCVRYLIPQARWPERAAKMSFWCLNLGLAWMVFATLFPLGLLQLYHSVSAGYYDARSLKYIGSPQNALLEWLRFPGDVIFIVGGVLPVVYICWLGLRYQFAGGGRAAQPAEAPFTDLVTVGDSGDRL